MKWLEKYFGFLFGVSSNASLPVRIEKRDPLKTQDSRTVTIVARVKPATFYHPRIILDESFLNHFDIRTKGTAHATSSRRYGSVWLTSFQNGLADVPLSKLEDIAAILEGELEGQFKLLYTGGVPNVFCTRGKSGEICEGYILYSRDSGLRWFIGARPSGARPWDSKSTRVIYPTE